MFSPKIIDRNQSIIESKLNIKLSRYPLSRRQDLSDHIRTAYDSKGKLKRQLTAEERGFIVNEQLLCQIDYRYWATAYCNTPEAPIWMADGEFRSIGEVRIGDVVMGWEKRPTKLSRTPGKRRIEAKEFLTDSVVLAVKRRLAPIVRVTTKSGSVLRCTEDHWWSNASYNRKDKPWIQATVGAKIRRFVKPITGLPIGCTEREAGWVAGIYDGEGSCSPALQIAQSPSYNPNVWLEIHDSLTKFGFDLSLSATGEQDAHFRILGGRDELVRFLNQIKPVRRQRIIAQIKGLADAFIDEIVDVSYDSFGEVVSLQTSTGNYVAWGYASKNCTIEWDAGYGEGSGVGPIVFNEPQELLIKRVSEREELSYEQQAAGSTIYGIKACCNKIRQVGFTAFMRSAIAHRQTMMASNRALSASVDPDKKLELFIRDKLIYDNLPPFLKPRLTADVKGEELSYENGSRQLYQESTQRSGIGFGRQYDSIHLTEIPQWLNPRLDIELNINPAIPNAITTLVGYEAVPFGRGNWWHEFSEQVRKGYYEDWMYIYIPWYALGKKYAVTAPPTWKPSELALDHAQKVYETSHLYVDHRVLLSRDQLYWWSTEREKAVRSGTLAFFLTNYSATPEESFQHLTQSAFSAELIEQLANRASWERAVAYEYV